MRLDELETEHATLAVLEVAAHLDLLVEQGVLVAHEDDGAVHHTVR
ncbi:MAG: hypothetical protein QOE59_2610 [Actinomycetota bacterium]|jgi:hypothetical protein|nr:hypothetical protein [Actinomycetota bacterium]